MREGSSGIWSLDQHWLFWKQTRYIPSSIWKGLRMSHSLGDTEIGSDGGT